MKESNKTKLSCLSISEKKLTLYFIPKLCYFLFVLACSCTVAFPVVCFCSKSRPFANASSFN